MRAHALGAVNISVLRIANTAASLVVVKSVVSKGLFELGELKVLVGELSGTKGQLIHVFASSMSRTVIGARSALASLTFVPVEAFTFASLTVAKTLAGALSISVASIVGS
jgi:hypothetical protein